MKEMLIGSKMEEIDAKNRNLLGIAGRIVDETKNTITVETGKGIKKLIKSEIIFKLGSSVMNGEHLRRRPEDIK